VNTGAANAGGFSGRLAHAGLRGGALGGVGGSIITSSGMNQNFKEFANGANTGAVGGMLNSGSIGNSASALPIMKPSGFAPNANTNVNLLNQSTNHQLSSLGQTLIKNGDSPVQFSSK
jgi:hypothetical protein